MYHIHPVIDSDPILIIDPKTRTIINHSDPIKKVMQGDHNCERVTFQIPRYVDGHDMSLCNLVRVQYTNIGEDGTRVSGYDDITDLRADVHEEEDVVTCSWLISGKATRLAGPLNFGIQFACIRNDYIVYSWNTAVCTHVTVSPSLDCSSEEDGSEYDKTINDVPFSVDDKKKLDSLPTERELKSEMDRLWGAINAISPSGGVD